MDDKIRSANAAPVFGTQPGRVDVPELQLECKYIRGTKISNTRRRRAALARQDVVGTDCIVVDVRPYQ